MEITKDEFQQWKDSMITNEVFGEIRQRINDAAHDLMINAGVEPERDRYLCGMMRGYQDILDISYEGAENA